jgi:hypothetical protein
MMSVAFCRIVFAIACPAILVTDESLPAWRPEALQAVSSTAVQVVQSAPNWRSRSE